MIGSRPSVLCRCLPVLVLAACGSAPPGESAPRNLSIPKPDPAAASVADGYRVEIMFSGLMYPSSIEFDDADHIYIAECGTMPGLRTQKPKVLRFDSDGSDRKEIVTSGLQAPVTDLLWHEGRLWISHRTKVSVLEDGHLRDVITDLPCLGDHSNNQLAVGPDGKIYVGVGTATNAGVVGPDNFASGWPLQHPEVCEVPARDVVLTGEVFECEDPRNQGMIARTSAYQPFGKVVPAGTVVRGRTRCNGAILCVDPSGTGLEVYAWGFRNPYGLLWTDGKLYCTDAGSDERGTRQIANAPDKLWLVMKDAFYGWPDFVAGKPVADAAFAPSQTRPPRPLWQHHPQAQEPLLTFEPHASATQIEVCRNSAFAPAGTLFVAASGDQSPVTAAAPVRAGYWVKRVDPKAAKAELFFTARQDALGGKDLEYVTTAGPRRLVDLRFDRTGRALYVVDIGPIHYVQGSKGPQPVAFPGTGVVWRIVRGPG